MTPPSTRLEPCGDTNHRGQDAPRERVALAKSLCAARGVRFTPLRRQVLELLWVADRPMGAYDLIERLQLRNSRPVAPPTVYRALEFLIAQGFVAKIESCNTYAPCAHPERRYQCLFLLCDKCGAAEELEDPQTEQRLAEDASNLGFRISRCVVEVQGTCSNCLTAESS
ncbi:MAG: transcriptional repressor [Pseudomonadota bacterium]